MRHQYGISVAEAQTFLLVKRPSAAISEEKSLPFAGYYDEKPGENIPSQKNDGKRSRVFCVT